MTEKEVKRLLHKWKAEQRLLRVVIETLNRGITSALLGKVSEIAPYTFTVRQDERTFIIVDFSEVNVWRYTATGDLKERSREWAAKGIEGCLLAVGGGGIWSCSIFEMAVKS